MAIRLQPLNPKVNTARKPAGLLALRKAKPEKTSGAKPCKI